MGPGDTRLSVASEAFLTLQSETCFPDTSTPEEQLRDERNVSHPSPPLTGLSYAPDRRAPAARLGWGGRGHFRPPGRGPRGSPARGPWGGPASAEQPAALASLEQVGQLRDRLWEAPDPPAPLLSLRCFPPPSTRVGPVALLHCTVPKAQPQACAFSCGGDTSPA